MGNFLVVQSCEHAERQARQIFDAGVAATQHLKGITPRVQIEQDWVCTAWYPRHNGSGASVVLDPQGTESWIAANGTWFHQHGYGVGKEAQLLDRYFAVGASKLAKELEGFFVIVIGDSRTRELFVLTDVVGSCHGYIRCWEGIVALSSSSLVLAALGEHSLDPIGCQEFLYAGILYEDRTVFQSVRKLGPATVFKIANGTVQAREPYWRMTDLTPNAFEGKKAVRLLRDGLQQAVRHIVRDFSRPVCDLTGGYDSRAVVGAFLSAGYRIETTVSGMPDHPDVVVSRGLTKLAGLSHLHLVPQWSGSFAEAQNTLALTDGECSLVDYIGVMDVHRRLFTQFDLSTNGSFGELARGYWWEILWPKAGSCIKLDAVRLAKLRYAAGRFDTALFPPELRVNLPTHLADVIERTNAGLSHLPNTMQMDHAYLMMRMQRWQGRIASSTNQLWPCLSPFMFRSVLELVLQTEVDLRRRSLLIRRLLTEMAPEFAAYPLENGCPAMPVTVRNFFRFTPLVFLYGRKILDKTLLRWSGPAYGRHHVQETPIQRLAQEEEVRDMMRVGTMGVEQIMDSRALRTFLDGARSGPFRYWDQWGRLLTLECTLRAVDRASAMIPLPSVR